MKPSRTILLLFFLSAFSCTEIKKNSSPSYKELEGYWVSGFLLHNTELSRSIAADNAKKPKVLLLRLKNEVNGFADTSFNIHGDTLLYRTGFKRKWSSEEFVESPEFYSFLITFCSKERLVLKDVNTLEETTYYNLSIIPFINDGFKSVSYSDNEIFITSDSIIINGGLHRMSINEEWYKSLNEIVKRINWNAAIFVREANNSKSVNVGEFSIKIPAGRPVYIKVITSKHIGHWDFSGNAVSDPVISALAEELMVFEHYCKLKGFILPVFCGTRY